MEYRGRIRRQEVHHDRDGNRGVGSGAVLGWAADALRHPPRHRLAELEQAARPVALPAAVHEGSAEVEIGLVLVVG